MCGAILIYNLSARIVEKKNVLAWVSLLMLAT